ncbi:OpgC domain-containing protein [Bradyrhizobium sp. CCBAU 51753]|uniref:OpgC domain-containing protein n=1 Tax=Bradyrhizobium sp. CCBAU 51753 TaxID=1325100 RepID=UPI00188B21DB|nr:OpgC domain-containing protein [Bradyrhizobium sp. CCBAU 51753]QOZ28505.1 OpgC domain-containing protein [Bradyrhizobium sp. CCBAU 51753]
MLSDCSAGRLNGGNLHRNPAPLTIGPGKIDSVPFDRDLRLDLCRGLALWCVFLDHIPNNVFSWLTLRHYGFSDATEVFMFVSGVTCALNYSDVRRLDGWPSVIAHTLLRCWQIYAAFLILTVALAVVAYGSGSDRLADEANVKILLQEPGASLVHAAILMYRPVNTDVLPTFVLFHFSFAPALWGILKFPNGSLLISAFIYALVQLYGWNLPEWPVNQWYFNPLAWQFLVVIGAWWVTHGYRIFGRDIVSWPVVVAAIAYLGISLVITLSWEIEPLAAAIPSYFARLIYPIDKTDLDPLRLLHFLAIAIVVARFVPPNWQAFARGGLKGAIRCGERSLETYCAGVVLSLLAGVYLTEVSNSITTQFVVSAAGIALLVLLATCTTWINKRSRQHPKLL